MAFSYDNKPVLLVEDDPFWHGLISDALAEEHIFLDWARSASACMDLLSLHKYAVIIMDLNLTGSHEETTGIDLTTTLTADWFIDNSRYTVVVILTDYRDPEKLISSITAGSVNFQHKPRTAAEHTLFLKQFPVLISSLIFMVETHESQAAHDPTSFPTTIERGNVSLSFSDSHTPPIVTIDDSALQLREKERLVLTMLMRHEAPVPDHMLQEFTNVSSLKSLRETCRTLNRTLRDHHASFTILRDFRGTFLDTV